MQVDLAVVEVGLGGSRDATNVFDSDSLQLAVISAIGLEHQKALGEACRFFMSIFKSSLPSCASVLCSAWFT